MGLLGLTFKAGTDDLRESPALRLAEVLVEGGARVVAFDPVATQTGVDQLARAGIAVEAAGSAEAAAVDADAIVVGTEWPEFGRLDWAAMAPTMRGRVIADARRIVDRNAANDAGLTVVALGVEHAPTSRDAAEPLRVALPVGSPAAV